MMLRDISSPLARTPALTVTILALLFAFTPPAALGDETDARAQLAEAWQDAEVLDDLLDDRNASNNSILAYLDLVVTAAREIALPVLDDDALDALPPEKRRAERTARRSLKRFHDEVEDLLIEALDESVIKRGGQNAREPVNRRAGRLLGQAATWRDEDGRRDLARRILRKIRRLERARHDVHADVFEGAFTALARLNDVRGLKFLMDEYLHTRKQPEDVARLRAALRSLRVWKVMSAKMRHQLVDELLKRYVAVEALAEQSTTDVNALAAKRFWDAVSTDVIPLTQYVAGYPRDESGQALATLAAFADWFREHDDARAAPWTRPLAEPR